MCKTLLRIVLCVYVFFAFAQKSDYSIDLPHFVKSVFKPRQNCVHLEIQGINLKTKATGILSQLNITSRISFFKNEFAIIYVISKCNLLNNVILLQIEIA